MKSTANYSFSKVPAPNIQRSVFNRSSGHKTTINEGDLIPFFVDEVLPGDTFSMRAQIFARLSTLLTPVMDNMFVDMHFFYVPCRLLWEHWENFMGARDNPTDETDYEIPQVFGEGADVVNFPALGLADYFGLPVDATIPTDGVYGVNALPFRAYNLIWNEWYRDENLQNPVDINTDDGPDTYLDYNIKKRNKRPDYFSSCLPWPQKGDVVQIPLGTTAPVIGNGTSIGFTNATDTFGFYANNSTGDFIANENAYGVAVGSVQSGNVPEAANAVAGLTTDPTKSGVIADLSAATAASINSMRLAVAMQQVLERDARGGTRYTEHLMAHWGVASQDFRLQRPEYLGGSSDRVNVTQVPQTSESTVSSKQANLSGFGTIASHCTWNKSFVEHGYVIGIVNFRADQTYQQNIRRLWSRKTRWDFYLPTLAHLGEQPVYVGELCFNPDNVGFANLFGYQERWAEYRYFPSMVTGAFRSGYAGSLDIWHLALDFIGDAGTGLPALNDAFIQDAPPISRIVAVTDEPHLIVDSYFSLRTARPMPVFSQPGLLRF